MIDFHFTIRELFKSCSKDEIFSAMCSPVISSNLLNLVLTLESLRNKVGEPIYINSGYRNKEHNARVEDSSPTSQHMEGLCADIYVTKDMPKLIEIIRQYPKQFGQVIYYPQKHFVHISIPNKKYPQLKLQMS